MKRLKILGVPIDKVDMDSAISRVADCLRQKKKCVVCTPNSEIVMLAQKSGELRNFIETADLVVPDGIGLVLASRIVKNPLSERVTGIDLMDRILGYCSENGKSVFIMGSRPGVAEKAAANISQKFKDISFAGTHHGYFKGYHTGCENSPEEVEVIEKINAAKPDVLFIAMGAPKQELWISKHKDRLDATIIMGVGGSADVYAGEVQRAPMAYQKLGLEWLYRLIKEPWRYKRMMALPAFVVEVIKRGEN